MCYEITESKKMKHSLIREILPPEIASTSTNPFPTGLWKSPNCEMEPKVSKGKKSELRDGMVNSGKVLIARWNI